MSFAAFAASLLLAAGCVAGGGASHSEPAVLNATISSVGFPWFHKPALVTFAAKDLFPESFDYDPIHRRFIVGSLAYGSISTVEFDGQIKTRYTFDPVLKLSTAGVKVDVLRKRVLVTAVNAATANGVMIALRLGDFKPIFTATGPTPSFWNDVTVDAAGNAYTGGSITNVVYKVSPSGVVSTVVALPNDPPTALGLNGITHVWRPFGNSFLLVANIRFNSPVDVLPTIIYKVSLKDGSYSVVQLDQPIFGLDGIQASLDGRRLYAATLDAVHRLESQDNWATATVKKSVAVQAPGGGSPGMTAVRVAGRSVYALEAFILDSPVYTYKSHTDFYLKRVDI